MSKLRWPVSDQRAVSKSLETSKNSWFTLTVSIIRAQWNTLRKICEDTSFLQPVFFRIRIENSLLVGLRKTVSWRILNSDTAWKVSVFRVILVNILPHSDWIRSILRISQYSVRMGENADQNNSEYGHLVRSVINSEMQNNGWDNTKIT